jgi:hypothetical protein
MTNALSSRSRPKAFKVLLYIAGSLLVLLIAGYLISPGIIRRKLDEALRGLPSSMKVTYRSLHANVLTGSLSIEGVDARYIPVGDQEKRGGGKGGTHTVTIEKIEVSGFSVFAWLRSHRVRVRDIRLSGVSVHADEDLLEKDSSLQAMKGPEVDALVEKVEVTGLTIETTRKGKRSLTLEGRLRLDSVTGAAVGGLWFLADSARYVAVDANETIRLRRLEVDSRKKLLTIDTVRAVPDMDREAIGRAMGHQVDVARAELRGVEVTGLDVMGLAQHRLYADEISLRSNTVHIFRDRRLPLLSGEKAMPMEGLKSMPVELRVKRLKLGPTRFEYEEFPKVGSKGGALVIEHFHGTMEPLVNKPRPGDPAFITLTTEGSLMGSGTVTATTRMPFHKGAFYEVQGAFHNLDVTKLNNPAENLGQLHLESGMLNSLEFQFEMGEERSTGKIVGEYHDLVVDKMKEKNGQLKTDKVKSFALRKFIIPKDKDKSLPLSKRTGKVDYKRDKEREFSYYMLHSLLVGVKSSFSLGFLLPG